MNKKISYPKLANLLVQLRSKAGFTQQSELAALLKTTQQTVSRWESGLSRPRYNQVPLLATALKADVDELLIAAGYTTAITIACFDQPFPVDSLNPDSFERFCLYFVKRRYPTAEVHRAGGSGHTQNGLDVDVKFPDKTYYTFQCKREKEFSPQKVDAAVAKHTKPADKKTILLTRIASPQSRDAIRSHATWDIWDKEDISREIRQKLSKEEQIKLVDTFFRGQRLALLGVTEAGPWQTTEEFFAPFGNVQGYFSHAWNLVGRDEETRHLLESLSNDRIKAIFLVGSGGSGKTRVLKQAIEAYESDQKSVLICFLSPTEEVTSKYLDDLGDREKLLIVDDAHERQDLNILFRYASIPDNKTKLLLSLRPYGLEYIKAQASSFALSGEFIVSIKLDPLNLEQAIQLAGQVLEKCNGPISAAKDIARLTLDCPLATVIGAQIVSKEMKPFDLVRNEESFRDTILGRFQKVIAGNIGKKNDEEPIRKILRVLALLQPFHIEDETIPKIIEQVEGIQIYEANRLIRLLSGSGVLFKRGGKYRLSPDMLADYIIDENCIGESGQSTGYAEQIFDVAGNQHIEHILLNLGKLDWQLAKGDTNNNSQLLNKIWKKLNPIREYSDPHIKAVEAVAYYQPKLALGFVENLMRDGKFLEDLPRILKYIAYNIEYINSACACLWELGKNDNRELHQHPNHAIRILSELCTVEPNKPFEYIEAAVDFALFLLESEDSWESHYSPFDILKGILKTEAHTTSSDGLSFSIHPFLVNKAFVSTLRNKVIDTTIRLFTHPQTKLAILAAKFIHDALRGPHGECGMQVPIEIYDAWTEEFVQTLEKIETSLQNAILDNLVFIEIARSISWHANYGRDKEKQIARRILSTLPNSIEFRTNLMLIDGYGLLFERADYENHQHEQTRHLEELAMELITTYPAGEELRSFIEKIISKIDENHKNSDKSPGILYFRLLELSLSLAEATIENSFLNTTSTTRQFTGAALFRILYENREQGLAIAHRLFASGDRELHASIGHAYRQFEFSKITLIEGDIEILRKILESNDAWVLQCAVLAVRSVAKNNSRLAIDLLKLVRLELSSLVTHQVFMFFSEESDIPFELLNQEDIEHFLKNLMLLPEVDDYWIDSFLSNSSKYYPWHTAKFFMGRVEYAAITKDWNYRPCNYAIYRHKPLFFRQFPDCGTLVGHTVQWMKSRPLDNYRFHHLAAELFATMFYPFDDEIIKFLQEWLNIATLKDIRIISGILKKAGSDFVFTQRSFVAGFLEKVKPYGKKQLDSNISDLYGAAISGSWSGTLGEPSEKHLRLKRESEKALHEIQRFSAAYRLYEDINKDAEEEIKRSLQEREKLDN